MPNHDAHVARLVTGGAAVVATALGAFVFAGWAFDIEPMRRGLVSHIHMLPNTSVLFVLSGLSLWLVRTPDSGEIARRLSMLLALIVMTVGGITLAQHLFNWDAGIDLLLFPTLTREHNYIPPGRMVSTSALGFLLSGIALAVNDRSVGRIHLPQPFATASLTIAAVALVGYMYGAQELYRGDQITGMALVTALAFLSLNVGILTARPSGGMVLLFARSHSARFSRRQLAMLVLVPLIMGKLLIIARDELLVSRETAIALLVVAAIAILVTVTMLSAMAVNHAEEAREQLLAREATSRQEAEAAIRAKNDFLAVMSHELRTPLHAIIGYSSLLQEGIPEPLRDGQRRQVERVTASARHLLALIDDVLMLSRMELGEERLDATEVNVRRLMEESAAMVEPQARARGLSLIVEPPSVNLLIQSDANRLRQAFLNVLNNAIKFTDQGTVRFSVTVEQGDDMLRFDIDDTGRGISAEHLDRVFESFWQVDQATTRRVGGVGLGLYVTRQIARLLGGDITVASTLGKGSCFSIRLPRYWWGSSTAEFPRATPTATEIATPVIGSVPVTSA